jgi:hypothetical protein
MNSRRQSDSVTSWKRTKWFCWLLACQQRDDARHPHTALRSMKLNQDFKLEVLRHIDHVLHSTIFSSLFFSVFQRRSTSRRLRSDEEVKEAVDDRLAEQPKDLLSRRICFLVGRWGGGGGEERGGDDREDLCLFLEWITLYNFSGFHWNDPCILNIDLIKSKAFFDTLYILQKENNTRLCSVTFGTHWRNEKCIKSFFPRKT